MVQPQTCDLIVEMHNVSHVLSNSLEQQCSTIVASHCGSFEGGKQYTEKMQVNAITRYIHPLSQLLHIVYCCICAPAREAR